MANRMRAVQELGPSSVIDISPEHLFRRERTIRYERGGLVFATDGLVGRLRNMVVDESAAEAIALVIQVEKTGHVVMLPIQAVDKTAGNAVYLTGSHRQFSDWASRAPVYQRKHAKKANLKALLRDRVPYSKDPRRTILQAGRDHLETAAPPPAIAEARRPLAITPPTLRPTFDLPTGMSGKMSIDDHGGSAENH
jgi:hypothetical protein